MELRKKPSLYGDLISTNKLNEQTWLQSEKLPSYLEFYARDDLLDTLRSNSNQLIVGRRGTGKTHLLGAFNEKINNENEHISILMSALDFTGTPLEFIDESKEFLRAKYSRILFSEFLTIFISKFIDAIDDFSKRKGLAEKTISKIEDKELLIWEEIEKGSLQREDLLIERVKDVSAGKENRVGKQGGAEAALNLATLTARLGFGGRVESQTSNATNETERIINTEKYRAETKLFKVKDLIKDILKIARIKVLYILIDEWMELDKNLNLGIQPYFAQLLKRVFFNDKRFSVKIASVWHRTDLYNQLDLDKSKGLEIGNDIELGADMDTAFISNEGEILTFFKEMIRRRLLYKLPGLKALENLEGLEDILVDELFEDSENLKTLIAVCHGIPRKFWQIFYKCCARIKNNFHKRSISKEIICQVAQDIYLTEKRKTLETNSGSHNLWVAIDGYMQETDNIHFVIENDHVRHSPLLRKLIDEELLHQIPSAITPKEIRDTHKTFMIDYGSYIDWLQTKHRDIRELLDAQIFPRYYQGKSCNIANYLNLSELLYTADKLCPNPNCSKRIDFSHPVVAKHKVCNYCGVNLKSVEETG